MAIWISGGKIGIDMDDVIFDFVGPLTEFHNKNWGTRLKKEHLYTYYFHKAFGCKKKEASRRIDMFLDGPEFEEIKPAEGAIEGLRRLKAGMNELFVVSSRHERFFETTVRQLEKYAHGVFSDIYLSKNAYVGHGGLTKAEICWRKHLTTMIEDSPEYSRECARYSRVLLIDQPWNRKVKCSEKTGIIRLKNGWGDINKL